MNKIMHPIEPEELMAYLDGELSSEKASVIASHLSDCEECREVATESRYISQTLTSWDVGAVDSGVPPALSTELDERGCKKGSIPIAPVRWQQFLRRRWQSAAWIGAFAVVLLAASIGSNNLFRARRPSITEYDRVAIRPDAPTGPQTRQYAYSAPTIPSPEPAVVGDLVSQKSPSVERSAPPPPAIPSARVGEANSATVSGPMIIRTADLMLITKDFDNARSAVESILKRHRGHVAELKVGGSTGSGRSLTTTLRVPADQLDSSVTDLKTLGRVESESQNGQDVTSQYVDLQARLANARNTEQRLIDLLRQRTGKLSDVLEVEQEVARVRGEIEQMEAERKNMSTRLATRP